MHPDDCHKTPIVVGYTCDDTSAHLVSLVGYEGELFYVSLVDDHGKRLPVWRVVSCSRVFLFLRNQQTAVKVTLQLQPPH